MLVVAFLPFAPMLFVFMDPPAFDVVEEGFLLLDGRNGTSSPGTCTPKMSFLSPIPHRTATNILSITVHVNYLRISRYFHSNHALSASGRAFLHEEHFLKLINNTSYAFVLEISNPFRIGLQIRVREQPELTHQEGTCHLLTVRSFSDLCLQQLTQIGAAI